MQKIIIFFNGPGAVNTRYPLIQFVLNEKCSSVSFEKGRCAELTGEILGSGIIVCIWDMVGL